MQAIQRVLSASAFGVRGMSEPIVSIPLEFKHFSCSTLKGKKKSVHEQCSRTLNGRFRLCDVSEPRFQLLLCSGAVSRRSEQTSNSPYASENPARFEREEDFSRLAVCDVLQTFQVLNRNQVLGRSSGVNRAVYTLDCERLTLGNGEFFEPLGLGDLLDRLRLAFRFANAGLFLSFGHQYRRPLLPL